MLTIDAASEALDVIDVSDPEAAHQQADEILLATVPPPVAEAYQLLMERLTWRACG